MASASPLSRAGAGTRFNQHTHLVTSLVQCTSDATKLRRWQNVPPLQLSFVAPPRVAQNDGGKVWICQFGNVQRTRTTCRSIWNSRLTFKGFLGARLRNAFKAPWTLDFGHVLPRPRAGVLAERYHVQSSTFSLHVPSDRHFRQDTCRSFCYSPKELLLPHLTKLPSLVNVIFDAIPGAESPIQGRIPF